MTNNPPSLNRFSRCSPTSRSHFFNHPCFTRCPPCDTIALICSEGTRMSRTYHIWTLGCQMNEADSQRLGSELEKVGYQAASNPDEADILVVNTCVVRQS